MTKNAIFLTVVAVLLAAVYIYNFTDWFQKETIQIIPTIRAGRPSAIPHGPDTPDVCPVTFAFDGKYRLTSIKVVHAEDAATNKYPYAIWHMVSEKGASPQKAILYGQQIRGMKPAVPRARPDPLLPDVQYLLVVEAGKAKGQTNFYTRAIAPRSR